MGDRIELRSVVPKVYKIMYRALTTEKHCSTSLRGRFTGLGLGMGTTSLSCLTHWGFLMHSWSREAMTPTKDSPTEFTYSFHSPEKVSKCRLGFWSHAFQDELEPFSSVLNVLKLRLLKVKNCRL